MKRSLNNWQRIGLVANAARLPSRRATLAAARLIARSGRRPYTDAVTAAAIPSLKCQVCADVSELARTCDAVVVCGGDGTILRVAREFQGAPTPILGINAGRLGFLTAVPSPQLGEALASLWAGQYNLEPRALIEAGFVLEGKPIALRALNDVVITRGALSRMIELDVTVNGEPLTRFRCDGLILSTPTGSTAYSMSAGGAIISPQADVLSLTPICPHTLSNRSVIVSLDATIEVRVISERVETIITADGQVHYNLKPGIVIRVRRYPHPLRLIRLAGNSFFQTVQRKLNWSGSNV